MESPTAWIVLGVFSVATLALAAYGGHLYVLLHLFRRRVQAKHRQQIDLIEHYRHTVPPEKWPVVTTQLPIYNERDVAERVIEAVAAFEYPAGKHEIQVLDDSDDRTRTVVDRAMERLRAIGVNIHVVRRSDRTAYKAGALAHGLTTARGKYVAIFDADFVPPPDFLIRAIPLLETSPDSLCPETARSASRPSEQFP